MISSNSQSTVSESFLVFGHDKISQAQLVFNLSQMCNQSFLEEALVPLNGEWYSETKNWLPVLK